MARRRGGPNAPDGTASAPDESSEWSPDARRRLMREGHMETATTGHVGPRIRSAWARDVPVRGLGSHAPQRQAGALQGGRRAIHVVRSLLARPRSHRGALVAAIAAGSLAVPA